MSTRPLRIDTPLIRVEPSPSNPRVTAPETPSLPFRSRRLIPLAGAVLLFGLILGYSFGRQPIVGLEQEISGLQNQIADLQVQNTQREARLTAQLDQLRTQNNALQTKLDQLTACSDGKDQLAQITGFLNKSQYATAADLAEGALTQTTQPLCAPTRLIVQGLWYEARFRAFLTIARPDFPDLTIQQKVVTAWQSLEQQADRFGMPLEKRWDPMSVATLATNSGWYVLADAAFQKAWKEGTVGPEGISLRYALLRNEGHELAFKGTPAMRDQAITLLATAHAIARSYALPNDPACSEDLHQLGLDCSTVAPDPDDPVLRAAQKK